MLIGNCEFSSNKTYVMGILNVTPDSFSDGGKYTFIDEAIRHAVRMQEEGASIIDIGGESTRPGYTMVDVEEEISRVCPVIEKLKKEISIPVSLDTYKSQVASAGIMAGADFINDIWGLKYDSDMAKVIAKSGLPCCLMHNRNNGTIKDFWSEYIKEIKECVAIGLNAGILPEKMVIDPGVGFGKTYEENLMVINRLDELSELGYPVLLGTSRKSVVGITLDLPVSERLEGTLATSVIGVIKGCRFLRVHDVKENVHAVKMTEAIINAGQNNY